PDASPSSDRSSAVSTGRRACAARPGDCSVFARRAGGPLPPWETPGRRRAATPVSMSPGKQNPTPRKKSDQIDPPEHGCDHSGRELARVESGPAQPVRGNEQGSPKQKGKQHLLAHPPGTEQHRKMRRYKANKGDRSDKGRDQPGEHCRDAATNEACPARGKAATGRCGSSEAEQCQPAIETPGEAGKGEYRRSEELGILRPDVKEAARQPAEQDRCVLAASREHETQ